MRMNRLARHRTDLAARLLALACFLSHTNSDAMTPINQFFASGPQAALEIAIRSDDTEGLAAALAHGASVNAKGKFNITPLMVAVDAQSPRAVRTLLEAGALPNALAQDGNGPVSLAVKSYLAKPFGRDIMLAIFRGGGDPNARQPDGDPVLMRFIYDRDVADLKLMKSLGANLDILDRTGDPLVTSVAMSQDWDMAWALIELGAAYDYEDGKSRRPLSLALKGRYPAPDSPLHAYKLKVWQLLKDKGIAVPPLAR
jgi:ankyrin repeat protein